MAHSNYYCKFLHTAWQKKKKKKKYNIQYYVIYALQETVTATIYRVGNVEIDDYVKLMRG